MSHCCFVFLDDGISGHPERRVSASAARLLEPMQVGQWLGFVTDTMGALLFRELARVADFINSLYLAVVSWQSALLLGYSRGRCMQLFKPVRSGIVSFLFLRL